MPVYTLADDEKAEDDLNAEDSLEAAVEANDNSDQESLDAKTVSDDVKIVGVDDVVYVHDDKNQFYAVYNGSEEFYDADDSGKNYYDLLMKTDEEKSGLPVVEMHEDKVEKQAEQVQAEAWRANGGINFLMSDGLTKYEHTDMVAASSVDDEERRIFTLMYPGWCKCLYDLGRVTVINAN